MHVALDTSLENATYFIGSSLFVRTAATEQGELAGLTKDRQQGVDRFQNDEAIPVFLISLKAGDV